MMGIIVYRGEDRKLNFTITDPDGTALDISGAEVYFQVSNQLPADEYKLDIEATNESADGTCEVILSDTDTDIEPKLYYYEVWVDFGGTEYSAEVGKFLVKKRVTK